MPPKSKSVGGLLRPPAAADEYVRNIDGRAEFEYQFLTYENPL